MTTALHTATRVGRPQRTGGGDDVPMPESAGGTARLRASPAANPHTRGGPLGTRPGSARAQASAPAPGLARAIGRVRRIAPALALAAALLAPASLHAQGWVEVRHHERPGAAVVRLRTAVSIEVTDRIARVEVEEWFENRGGPFNEADYLYPLPGEAVFADFSLFQGDEELRGETMDAERARKIYEEIVRSKRDPALIELAGHGLLRARIFPFAPGERRKITLRYTQVLERAGDALQFRYLAGGRNRGPGGVGGDVAPVPHRDTEPAPLVSTLRAQDGSRFHDPFSPTHELRVKRENGALVVEPVGTLAGHFSLFLPFARGPVGTTLVTHRADDEDGYFMLTLSPGQVSEATQPRDVTVVLDVSGSMSGSKIVQARDALRQLLGTLGEEDRFRLITFSSRVVSYRPGWTPARGTEIERAHRWIDGLQASGGTNISGALAEAFRLDSPEQRLPIVIFITDGQPSTGETDPDRIAQIAEQARRRARIFTFGVGYDVNTYLLDRLSAAGRGTTAYVAPGEDVESAVASLAHKIRYPVLTDLVLANAPVRLTEVYPQVLPDLFAGEDLVIFGRYERTGADRSGRIELVGRRSGRTERYGAAVRFPAHESGNDYIPRLWAARKLGALMQTIRLEGATPELVEEARRLALRYGLLSEYTAYLVQEPEVLARDHRSGPDVRIAPMAVDRAPAKSATGRAAVAASARDGRRMLARSGAELERAEIAAFESVAPAAVHEATAAPKLVAGRFFVERDGIWTDLGHKPSGKTVHIEPYGPAYFALLEAVPELRPYWSAFEHSIVAGHGVAFKVAPGGVRNLSREEVRRLVREFRG